MRVLLVDDHVLFSSGMQFLLQEKDEGVECVHAESIAQATASQGPFDLILLDYSLPDSNGGEGLSRVLLAHEGTTVVIVTAEMRLPIIQQLIDQGAAGVITKSSHPKTLVLAIETVLAGGVYLPKDVLPAVDVSEAMKEIAGLTPKQKECLMKACVGKSNKIIAREMGVTEATIKSHLLVSFRALGVATRSEAVFKVAKMGLLPAHGIT